MVPQPEQEARKAIDDLLARAGWSVCDAGQVNLSASRGVAIREFPLKSGHGFADGNEARAAGQGRPVSGFADYLLYIDGKAAGVIEAKKEGVTLTGVDKFAGQQIWARFSAPHRGSGTRMYRCQTQAAKYIQGLPDGLPRWANPLPFSYQSTGTDKSAGQQIWARFSAPRRGSGTRTYRCQTRFTNGLDPAPRSRPVFAFHKPETLAAWLEDARITPSPLAGEKQTIPSPSMGEGEGGGEYLKAANTAADYRARGQTVLARLQRMPPLKEAGLWPAQITAIHNLEQSLKENRPRALIQMATGSGKTFTAISFIYRLIKFAGAKRILFLVDRGNLADQTLKEFQQYASPYNNFKFTEEYIVQRLQGNILDTTARVCICTIQRMYSMLKGKDLPEDLEEVSPEKLLLPSPSGRGAGGEGSLFARPEPIEYNPAIPIESFDIIVTDECHRSIYDVHGCTNAASAGRAGAANLWAQVLEYFDASLIGLTATPSKQTFGFFHQNLVMEYNHEMAVADGVNVNYDVYRIRTRISEAGYYGEADVQGCTNVARGGTPGATGYSVQIQERDTRKKRWEQLDDDFSYDPNQLDRDVVGLGEPEKEEGPVDLLPGERVGHGWPTLGSQAEQVCGAQREIRTIVRTFKEKLFTEIFPGRTWVPKTLIFAKGEAETGEHPVNVRPAERVRHGRRTLGFRAEPDRERRNTPTRRCLVG